MVSHSKNPPTDVVEPNEEDKKKFLGERGRGKAIDRIDHQTVIREAETDLQEKLASMRRENHVRTEPSASTHSPLPPTRPPWP